MSIRCLILDVDGTLTKGDIIYTSSGEELKVFNAQDGLGLALARKAGLILAVITGRTSPMVKRRMGELKFDYIAMGIHNKVEALQELMAKYQLQTEEIAYMGDDLNDLGIMKSVGLGIAPANGVELVKDTAHYVTTKCGGEGAVREALEYILGQDGRWDAAVEDYVRSIEHITQ